MERSVVARRRGLREANKAKKPFKKATKGAPARTKDVKVKRKKVGLSSSLKARTPARSRGLEVDVAGDRFARLRRREKVDGQFDRFWDAEEEEKQADENAVTKRLDFSAFSMEEDMSLVSETSQELNKELAQSELDIVENGFDTRDLENQHPNVQPTPRQQKAPRGALKVLRCESEKKTGENGRFVKSGQSPLTSQHVGDEDARIPVQMPIEGTMLKPFTIYQSPQRRRSITGTWLLDSPSHHEESQEDGEENSASPRLATSRAHTPPVRHARLKLCILQRMFG